MRPVMSRYELLSRTSSFGRSPNQEMVGCQDPKRFAGHSDTTDPISGARKRKAQAYDNLSAVNLLLRGLFPILIFITKNLQKKSQFLRYPATESSTHLSNNNVIIE